MDIHGMHKYQDHLKNFDMLLDFNLNSYLLQHPMNEWVYTKIKLL